MDAVRKLGVRLGTHIRQERGGQGMPMLTSVRPCKANQLVAAVPFSACLFHPSAPVLCRTGLTVGQSHRRPFLLAPNTFAAACTVAHKRPKSLYVPPLEPVDPAAAPLPKPRDDTDLDTALALVFATVRYRVGMGLPLPDDMRALGSYLALMDYSAACTLGMIDCDVAMNAAMWQHAHAGLSEEALTEMIAAYVVDEAFEASDDTSAQMLADACRRLFPRRELPPDAVAHDKGPVAATLDGSFGGDEAPAMSAAEEQGYVHEVLSASIGSALHDARRSTMFLPVAEMVHDGKPLGASAVERRGRSPLSAPLPCIQAFVPFASLMNPSGSPSCGVTVNLSKKTVDIRTTRAVPPGGELTLRYRTNSKTAIEHEVEMITRYNSCE